MQKWIENIEEKEEINLKNKIDNTIIVKKEELNLISDRIQNNENLKKIYKLIFRATRDGKLVTYFSSRFDRISSTITFIQSENRHKFGGFAGNHCQSLRGWIYDDKDKIFIMEN